MHDLFGDDGLWQIGPERVAAIEARRLGQRGLVHHDEDAPLLFGELNELVEAERVRPILQPGQLGLRRRLRMLVQIGVGRPGGGSQGFELVGPRGRQFLGAGRIAAQHISLAIPAFDLGQRLLEQVHLQHAGGDESVDLRFRDGGDVMEAGGPNLGALRGFDHAAVADEGYPLGPESGGRLVQLRGERFDVGGVAGEDLDRQRTSVGVGEQADHDLPFARLAISVVAERGEGVVLALQIRAGDVVEKDVGRRGRVSLGKQPALDVGLIVRQPIQIGVEVVFVEADRSQRRADGMAARQTNRRQPRALIEHAGDDLPERQLALSARAQGGDDAEFARQLGQNPNRPHRGPLPQLGAAFDGGRQDGAQVLLVFQRQPDRLHFLRLAVGEIGQRSMFDLAVLTIRLAQQVAGVGLAVEAGDRAVDEHYGYHDRSYIHRTQPQYNKISGYTSCRKNAPNLFSYNDKHEKPYQRRGEHPLK